MQKGFGFLDKELKPKAKIGPFSLSACSGISTVAWINTADQLQQLRSLQVPTRGGCRALRGKDLDNTLLKGKLFIFRQLYEGGIFEKRKLQAILTFLDNYVRFENPEYNRKFSNEIDKITHQKNTMDIFEQVAEWRPEEAREEGLEKAVKVLLANTEFSVEKIASEVGVSVSFVERIKNKLQEK
jgi:hypothetical protein